MGLPDSAAGAVAFRGRPLAAGGPRPRPTPRRLSVTQSGILENDGRAVPCVTGGGDVLLSRRRERLDRTGV